MRIGKLGWAVVLVVTVVAFGGTWASAAAEVDANGGHQGRMVHALGAITVGSGWNTFGWDGAAPAAVNENPFTFTCAGPCTLQITDAFLDGDQFAVYDNLSLLGNTSTPANNGYQIGARPDLAFYSPLFSQGDFILAAGAHSVTLTTIAEASGSSGGAAYLQVVDGAVQGPTNLVPTLSTWGLISLLVAVGLVGLFLIVRRLH